MGKRDGAHVFPGREWTPKHIICKDERTIHVRECEAGYPIYSPETRTCESLYNIPKRHGGSKPECTGRKSGYYPDENGRCDQYFMCQRGSFKFMKTCTFGKFFDPFDQICKYDQVAAPCGNANAPNCTGIPDGSYADMFGRCPFYFECRNNSFSQYSKCAYGTFNPESGNCEITRNVPAPCGDFPNRCQLKKDGIYTDYDNYCLGSYICDNNILIQNKSCPRGLVYNIKLHRCDSPENTPPPCGLAPDCTDKEDGKYSAPLRGCEYYNECKSHRFLRHAKCSLSEGGFYFNSRSGKCDFPLNIIPPCGVKTNDW